jgi:importin-7
MYDNPEEFV